MNLNTFVNLVLQFTLQQVLLIIILDFFLQSSQNKKYILVLDLK